MSAKIEIDNITKVFLKDNKKFTVLNNIKFSVNKGEIVCILGTSGCGKSTLLRHIAGFEIPDSGHIYMDENEVKSPGADRVMVFQDFNQLYPWRTVLQNVIFPLEVKKIGKSNIERVEIARKFLKIVELDGFDNFFPHMLSGGMKQKVAIARSLILNPKVLLMDEPFGSLDAQTKSVLQKMLIRIWKETGVTIVFVTHDINEAIILSNRIVIMDRGNGNIKEVLNNTIERPRIPSDPRFIKMLESIYDML